MEEIIKVLKRFAVDFLPLSSKNSDKSSVFFHGFSDYEWKEEPTVFRNGNLTKEQESIEEVIRNFPDDFTHAHTIDVLTQLQHYGCPTRIFDVTSNILVAMFFACGGWEQIENKDAFNSNSNKDGKISIYQVKNDEIKSIDSETVTVIANIARLKYQGGSFGDLPWKCEKDMGAWQTDGDLVKENAQDANSVVLVKTKLNNPRVRAQFGSFFLFGGLSGISQYNINKSVVAKISIPFPKKYQYGSITIPHAEKQNILSSLERFFGISYATLCPEKHDVIKTLMNNNLTKKY